MRTLILSVLLASACTGLRADFSYQESTQMTGGIAYNALKLGGPLTRGAREAQISTVSVKGNRMLTTRKDAVTIVDLDKESITEINIPKKTYSVVTFAQMKAAMEKALADAEKKQKKDEKAPNVEAKFKVSAKATGKTKAINGLNAKELMITMELEGKDKDSGQSAAMNMLTDAWMAPVAGYEEVKAFELKMAQKMGAIFRPGMEQQALVQPEMVQGMAQAAREMAKVDGVPIQNIVRIGGAIDDLKAAANKPPEEPKEKQSTGAAAAGIAGRLSGFGRKKEEDKPEDKNQSQPGGGMLVEMTSERSLFSTAPVDASKFEVPAGFKEAQSDIAKRAR
ncbi:MAG: hypothetical protein ABI811_03110 [Acidobacteriota bacterium]